MRKIFATALILGFVLFYTTQSFAYGQPSRGNRGSGSNGTGTCPRLSQNYNSTTTNQFNASRVQGQMGRQNGDSVRQRIMDPTNPNCPYNNY